MFQEQSDIGLHCLLRPVCQAPDGAVSYVSGTVCGRSTLFAQACLSGS